MADKVSGFRFAATRAGIKADGPDVALAVAEQPASAAAVFTKNQVRAAPVRVAERRVASGKIQAVLVNSGCANACTGPRGERATLDCTRAVATGLSISEELVFPASTGVIGELLPADRITRQVVPLVESLSEQSYKAFAEAIMTTDRFPKMHWSSFATGGVDYSLLGVAKGAGMLHPDLGPPQATMLAFLFTDAKLSPEQLRTMLIPAVDASFNAFSVDGDTSTNDCVLLLASGRKPVQPDMRAFSQQLQLSCQRLARSMVADGEGTNHVAEIRVTGLGTEADARTVARVVATSLLVKTALYGKDPNWGRILAAAGRSGISFDPERARLWFEDVQVVEGGVGLGAAVEARAKEIMARAEYRITLELGDGPAYASYLGCDLGHEYVNINAGYRS